jgi:hypothetical protein
MILGRTLPSPLKITDSTTIKQIAESYKKVFGINHDDWLEEGFSKDFWVSQYNEFSELYKKQSQEGIRELEKALAPLEGKMPEEMYGTLTDTAAREKKARQDTIILARFRKLCFCTYNITIIAYGIAMGMAVFGYIIK